VAAVVNTTQGISTAREESRAAVTKAEAAVEKLSVMLGYLTRTGSADNKRLTDRELEEKMDNLQAVIDANKANDQLLGYDGFTTAHAKIDLQKAKDEADLRSEFLQQVRMFGEDCALSMHSALDEDRLKTVSEAQDSAKTAQTLEKIDQRLSCVFPANGVQPTPPTA
jgi:hypothetical protein